MNSSIGAKRALEVTSQAAEAGTQPTGAFIAAEGIVLDAEAAVDAGVAEAPDSPRESPFREILRTTGWFVLYGTSGFAVVCILVGAFESLFGQ